MDVSRRGSFFCFRAPLIKLGEFLTPSDPVPPDRWPWRMHSTESNNTLTPSSVTRR